jgi:hypothetical protein
VIPADTRSDDQSPDNVLSQMALAMVDVADDGNRVLVPRFMSEVADCKPLEPSGNYTYHLLQQSVTLHFVFTCFVTTLTANSDYLLKQPLTG